ncbi:MAG: hypothetical protein U9Q21_04615 [Candidatus Auribacterota bacterium]|nr:hypothetical protein [Candidatus Auribacterota bacterium]
MELFSVVAAMVFLVFGSLLLLSPESIKKIEKVTNKVIFTIDKKVHSLRRPLGVALLGLSIYLWFIAFLAKYK